MKSIYLVTVFFPFVFIFSTVSGDDVPGCNGFIKSDIDIDFSKVEVKLFTKQGSLKDRTECAPNNGYYFLPLYDRGEYVLKVVPPLGWAFEPSEVPLIVDGVSDPCSQGSDINFVFKGFAVTGKVVSDGHDVGPKGVTVTLAQDGSSTALQKTTTTDGGSFIFTPVLPGQYTVTAQHPKWKLRGDKIKVKVSGGNAEVKGLSVAGYDVTGSVSSDGQPIAGVTFVLFSDKPIKGGKVSGCDVIGSGEKTGPGGTHKVCQVSSDKEGKFVFPQLPPGSYSLVPHYASTSTKFHVHPTTLPFTLPHDSLRLSTLFQVKGFTVSGKVLWSENGKPMRNAIIKVNGNQVATTGPDGVYHLENMKAGTYKMLIEADGVEFKEEVVRVSATTLENMVPAKYKVCGRVTPSEGGVPVSFVQEGTGSTFNVETDSKGTFCTYLAKGVYSSSVIQSKENLQFSPSTRKVEVTDSIVDNVNFSQLKCTVKGKVICKAPCPPITINLKPRGTGNSFQTITKDNQEYEFTGVSPGDYDVFIGPGLEWCWKKESQVVTVASEITTVPTFVQSGRTMTVVLTHTTKLVYWSGEPGTGKNEVTVIPGRSHICVEAQGPIVVQPVGCHVFPMSSFRWESGAIKLEPVKHRNTFFIESGHYADDLMVNVVPAEEGGQAFKVRPKPVTRPGKEDKVAYEVSLDLRPGQKVTLIPSASLLLFSPFTSELKGGDDCTTLEEPLFMAEKGLVLTGKVSSGDSLGLGDATVRVVDEQDQVVAVQQTLPDGSYRFPPIRMSHNYRLKAEKEGYILTESSEIAGYFSAHKLAEIIVTVLDNGQPLQGVLLSLSGGENYRRNAQTNGSGTMSFISLSPGEYFLRAMMKEYSFKPAGKIINVQEGATINVQLSGERVAWSCHGRVVSLNGEGEGSVTVEAVGQGNCSLLQEEAASAPSGTFRIRGLQPNCEYKVRVKEGPEINTHIQKSTPDSIPILVEEGDVSGLVLYALRGISRTDVVVYVRFSDDEELRSAGRLRLAREDTPDAPLITVKLTDYAPRSVQYHLNKGVVVALGSVAADGKNYVVSTGGRTVTIKADAPLRLARLTLTQSTASQPSHPDLSRPVYPPVLILALLGAVVYYYRKKLMLLLADLPLGPVISDDSEDNSNRSKRTKSRKA